jgi:hypothetical protein
MSTTYLIALIVLLNLHIDILDQLLLDYTFVWVLKIRHFRSKMDVAPEFLIGDTEYHSDD